MKRVLAGGAFNILHPGHIFFLEKAKGLGDFLIVVVANDRTVKGKGYIIFPMRTRRRMVESLGIADKVVSGDRKNFFRVVKKERPDIIALGYDQEIDMEKLEGVANTNKLKIKITRIGKLEGYSTKKIIAEIKRK
jgi:FAD synthetase